MESTTRVLLLPARSKDEKILAKRRWNLAVVALECPELGRLFAFETLFSSFSKSAFVLFIQIFDRDMGILARVSTLATIRQEPGTKNDISKFREGVIMMAVIAKLAVSVREKMFADLFSKVVVVAGFSVENFGSVIAVSWDGSWTFRSGFVVMPFVR